MSKEFIPDDTLSETEFINKYSEIVHNKNDEDVIAYLKIRFKWMQGEAVDTNSMVDLHKKFLLKIKE